MCLITRSAADYQTRRLSENKTTELRITSIMFSSRPQPRDNILCLPQRNKQLAIDVNCNTIIEPQTSVKTIKMAHVHGLEK